MKKVEFSEREIKVMKLICREYRNEEIAEKLGLSVKAIDITRKDLFKRQNPHNRQKAIQFR